jgi:hypothetical protein
MNYEDAKKKPAPTGGKGATTKGQPGAKGPTGVTPPTKIPSGAGKPNSAKKR